MRILIFAKKRTKHDGGIFYNFLATLTNKKTGEALTVQVKFRHECGTPDINKCPRYIEIDKTHGNLTEYTYTTDDGEVRTRYELWISQWKDGGEFVDDSLEDFE